MSMALIIFYLSKNVRIMGYLVHIERQEMHAEFCREV